MWCEFKVQCTYLRCKQTVYKKLVFEWQIAKQLSGLNSLLLTINENYRLKKNWSFSFVINVKWLLKRQYTKFQLSQKYYWENFEITGHKCQFWIQKIIVFILVIGYLGKQRSNH